MLGAGAVGRLSGRPSRIETPRVGQGSLRAHRAGGRWAFQPTHDPIQTWENNVVGAWRVFDAVAGAHVPGLVHASSVGAYSPGPREGTVDESWPTHSWPTAAYGREKAYVERLLDTFELRHPDVEGLREGAGGPTPPLAAQGGGSRALRRG